MPHLLNNFVYKLNLVLIKKLYIMSKRNKKAMQKIFIEKVIESVNAIGAISIPPDIDSFIAQWLIETIYGTLQITLPKEHTFCFTIFCRFLSKAEKFSQFKTDRINKFSGKWNFHYGDRDDCVRIFSFELDEILSDDKIQKFCVPRSSIFDSELKYEHEKIFNVLRENGAAELSGENYFYQSNLPKVVTFYLNSKNKSKIADKLNEAFNSEWIRVEELIGWNEKIEA